ncbi:carbohydrate ABC transporter permease [Actinopolymorpha alba]|uniref:carbohydrate ABC transporter permease n=1 Tax=Actinopolymorpha alba TaxID=533267 RepID=UPI00037B6B36|nr:carbohydrate ABC transporter permease [Actinopolymorpha alba]
MSVTTGPTPGRSVGAATSWKSVLDRAATVSYYLAMSLLALGFLLPLIWMVSSSVKPEADILTVPPRFLPSTVTFANYVQAWPVILPYFLNSVKVAALSVGGLLVTAPLAGYAFARLRFPGRDALFLVLIGSALIPHVAYLIPQYIVFRDYGWLDTQYPLWVPRAFTPIFGTFLMRQFFKALPQELEDAAKIDGAGTFTVYWRIMLPLAKPALAAIGIFTFVESWNDLLGPLIFINSPELQTLPVALALFQGQFFTQVSALMAAATVTIVPVLLVFVFCQRYFIAGLASTGLKA